MKKGQSFSMDIMIAVGVFVLAFIAFYFFISAPPKEVKTATLTEEGELAVKAITESETSNISFISDNTIDEAKLQEVASKDYAELKHDLGLVSDFCIHFEDEKGNLINISDVATIGSQDINITVEDESGDIIVVRCG